MVGRIRLDADIGLPVVCVVAECERAEGCYGIARVINEVDTVVNFVGGIVRSWRAGRPGFARSLITSGRSWRNESIKPALTTVRDVGQSTFLPKCSPALAAACVQSRCDGSLKSPVRNTGLPELPARTTYR